MVVPIGLSVRITGNCIFFVHGGREMVNRIKSHQLDDLVKSGIELIDVRELDEIAEENIPGGTNWPLSTFGKREKDISKKRPTLFYCSSGLRSQVAAELAEEWTDQEIYSLEGGVREYREKIGSMDS